MSYIAVSMRELSRRTAAVLDRVADEGAIMLIVRHGVPVATLEPFDADAVPLRRPRPRRGPEQGDENDSAIELDPDQERALFAVRDHGHVSTAADALGTDAHALGLLLTRLEVKGLTRKTTGGFELTRTGARLVVRLERSRDARNVNAAGGP